MAKNKTGITALESALIVASVVLAIVVGALWYSYAQLNSSYNNLLIEYNNLQTQYSNLQDKYAALQSNYTSLQQQYSNLNNQYNALWSKYQGLESQYEALQSNYNSLDNSYLSLWNNYVNVSSVLNGIVSGMSGSGYGSINPGYYEFIGLIYVPSGCTVTGTITISSTGGPVQAYLGDWVSAMDYYAYLGGATSYGSWSWYYQWYGNYIVQTISLTTSYSGGDYYVLVIYNPNSFTISYTDSFNVQYVTCNTNS